MSSLYIYKIKTRNFRKILK